MNWSLLGKYIFNEAKEEEKKDIEKWIQEKPENKQLINDLSLINYKNTEEMKNNTQNIDVDKAWNRLKEKITESTEKQHKPVIRLHQQILKYAASVLILIGIGITGHYVYNDIFNPDNIMTMETEKFETRKDIYLPDGSLISMNDKSKVQYPEQFKMKERQVEVNGEVFFDVVRDESKPFVIAAKKARIKVLGTSFNVRTDLPDNAVEVFVKSGKVKLYRKDDENKALVIEPGYIGILLNDEIIKRKNDDINYLAWKTGKILFKETNLQHVVRTLNNTYNVKIEIADPEIKDLTLSASFDNESIDKVLQVLSKTFDIHIVKKDKHQFIIKRTS